MINVSILGGSGYAGGELLRLLLFHPKVYISEVTSRQFVGQPLSLIHPNLRKVTDLLFIHPDKIAKCDFLFVALPNGESMKIMPRLTKIASKIIDLGADFRLRSQSVFEEWYQIRHQAPQLLPKFVYGLAELHRQEIKRASYVSSLVVVRLQFLFLPYFH